MTIKAPVMKMNTQFLIRKFGSRKTLAFNTFMSTFFQTSQIFRTKKNPINPIMTEQATRIIFIVLSMRFDYNYPIKYFSILFANSEKFIVSLNRNDIG
jgi:hypothetical protein